MFCFFCLRAQHSTRDYIQVGLYPNIVDVSMRIIHIQIPECNVLPLSIAFFFHLLMISVDTLESVTESSTIIRTPLIEIQVKPPAEMRETE